VSLEIQALARSVAELRRLEIKVCSAWPQPEHATPSPTLRWVEPRDARAAGLSYDGREGDLTGLTTLPPRESAFLVPRLLDDPERCGWLYAEMVHPADVTRRIREGGTSMATARTTRYGLFGHDLEKGVVLRGRLRGIWLHSDQAKQRAHECLEAFLREPPPLGT
jgi:hypothetical protein